MSILEDLKPLEDGLPVLRDISAMKPTSSVKKVTITMEFEGVLEPVVVVVDPALSQQLVCTYRVARGVARDADAFHMTEEMDFELGAYLRKK